jgi:hypothetical protein
MNQVYSALHQAQSNYIYNNFILNKSTIEDNKSFLFHDGPLFKVNYFITLVKNQS